MRQLLDSLSTQILKLSLPLIAFLVPLFFLPITTDFFTPNKRLLLTLIASLCLLAWSLKSLLRRQLLLNFSPPLLPVLGLALAYLISSYFQGPAASSAFLGQTTVIVSLAIIFLTTTSTLSLASHVATSLNAFLLSVTLVALFTILHFLGLTQALTDVTWLTPKAFNPVGGPLPFLTLTLPAMAATIYLALNSTLPGKKLLLFFATAINLIAAIISVSLLLPQDNQLNLVVLPYSAGWSIAVDTFKNLRTALIGVGPESFSTAFAQFKPAFINRTPYWNLVFINSSNEYLHLLTTTGLLGLTLFLLATWRSLLSSLKHGWSAPKLLLLTSLVIQLFVPASLPLVFLTFWSLTLVTIELTKTPHLPTKESILTTRILFILALTLIGFNGYYRVRAYAAELTYYSSLQAAARNQGTQTYNLQIKAIQFNPQEARYRMAYSQTNLALANALASQGNISDQDRSNITQLVQQGIREGKVAVNLDPKNPAVWTNLASIYRQLINLAQGATDWTVATYTQAIALDPLNARLRLDLGSLYYSIRNYDQAIRLFTQATEAKPDWANAYYNLAAAYRENKQYAQALQAMRIVVGLVEPTSDDYQKAQDELKALEKLAPAPTGSTPSDELQPPTPLPSPAITPIKLPDESGLNIPPASPSAE